MQIQMMTTDYRKLPMKQTKAKIIRMSIITTITIMRATMPKVTAMKIMDNSNYSVP